ncbi:MULTISPECIES: glutathione S-transferase family protein [unclassified Undibacterium]|uniref:glutathione S-transferase family protein n=1 Tax=unclassified Undibacterium TaxID=2630295 RepID=UPI002AC9E742|nr:MULTISPECIES: glutathione S-transferase family protein [unclassified Undibacterium]MEB0139963.1 glutathione S-transferase family protein [Undibacterium sp. CCC2.1]MEB0172936.1 glutathione S-transferase family protein [Undibacterium sp. CCC1.1]MEB0176763.1 glutathione S-transferase family protein [Undibacterium sp. CCC3.4]MEB0216890.1 glutathione S-transferase family protein [Undibacterium sp. 5I2]WPX45002.1 glutathione S-transferase family protein [Undibacterium sp. CCC3.4]
MYTLYYSPGTASMLVHLALLETGAAHRLELVDFASGQQKQAHYLAINPAGVVPTLIVDGAARVESAALLMLLAERHPQSALAPASGSALHEAWREWLIYLCNNLQPAFRLWFYPSDLGYASHPAELSTALQEKIARIWEHLDQHLRTHGPYLLGQQFSGADLMLAMLMRWSRAMPRPATDWPALRGLAELVCARPSWHSMQQTEALSAWPVAA